jgi:DNA polymerase-3 subunit delta
VVFEARLDDKEKIGRLEKMLPGAVKVELERPAPEDAARYLTEEAKRNEYTLDHRAAAELVESTGGDLARARMELDKLMAYAGRRLTVTVEDVREMVAAEPAFIIWELGESIGRRDPRAALERLEAMLRGGHNALPILGLIASHMRRLLRAKAGSRQWFPDEVRRQAQKASLPVLLKALDRLHQADLELRSSPPDERLVLERLIFDLAR